MRKYVSGSRWAFWRWTEVDSGYITRLHIIKTPWFAVDMHWLNKPDPEPYLHDHPVTFLSIILRGGYTERRMNYADCGTIKTPHECVRRYYNHSWFNFIRASFYDRHSIIHVLPGTITLAFMSPKVREWGFHTPTGWIYWKDYYTEQRKSRGI